MTEVWFYHLERQPLEAVLPRILSGLMQRGEKVCVELPDAAAVDRLSRAVWAHEDTAFIAHGVDGDDTLARHALWLTCKPENPIAAAIRIYGEGAMPQSLDGLLRAMVFLAASDSAALQSARDLWKTYRAQGVHVRYWKQGETGRWEDQAASKAA
jgi:DNA polymerase-3 subunit chi